MTAVTGAAGIGVATLGSDGSVLDTWFPAPELTDSGTTATTRLALSDVPPELGALVGRDDDRGTETIA
ncbi:MAG: 2,3,4,5-tetrahydropyridine-2,6-dicarboxylate N-succinyltransferase, partial [Mycobacterium sp.]